MLLPPQPRSRSIMHLKSCSEAGVQRGAPLKPYGGNHGGVRRLPFGVLSTNTLCRSPPAVTSLQLKAPPRSSPMLRPSQPGLEVGGGGTATEDTADAALGMWAVIRPGHVREKIALFASEQRQADGGERSETSRPAVMSRAAKVKGSWEDSGTAKRLCKPADHHNLREDLGGPVASKPTVTPEEAEPKVSVVEMVAFLERRASEQQPDGKPLLALQRSSASITPARTAPPEAREGPDAAGEEPEKVRVSEMVAKLELECGRGEGGGLSRAGSLRRTVGRVLLATSDPGFPPAAAVMSSVTSAAEFSSSSLAEVLSWSGQSHREKAAQAPPPAPRVGVAHAWGREEPPPGLLFLTPPCVEMAPPSFSDCPPPHYKTRLYLEPARSPPSHVDSAPCDAVDSAPCSSVKRSETRPWEGGASAPLGRTPSASQDFLELRQRLQRLLAPPPYLLVLPHHLLVQILALLPTRSLAALKCCCSYFRFVIDAYGVRPADSLWVCDPRYRDDPCKQCKRRYAPGDVSLCRWHHKPYCQALPYGPGYWMCCRGARRQAPGCNVGLHDNRWVPAFHSINVPVCRRGRGHDN